MNINKCNKEKSYKKKVAIDFKSAKDNNFYDYNVTYDDKQNTKDNFYNYFPISSEKIHKKYY
jgi:hypothetical protein